MLFKTKTTIVVGAGASYELGMPTGDGLKGHIQEFLDIRFEPGNRQFSGSYAIAEALRGITAESEKYNRYLYAGWHIRDALPLAISIDNFVDNQESDHTVRMAKLAISQSILEAESKSKLHLKTDGRGHSQISWKGLEKTWLPEFFKTMVEGLPKSNIHNIFKNIDFVVFNYDRCLEFFLAKAISHYYKVPESEVHPIINDANIMHPYGTTGKLPWQQGDGAIANFGDFSWSELLEISDEIITFTEQMQDDEMLGRIRQSIDDADQLLFLGFAFNDSNMDLIQPDRTGDTMRTIGTAYGISDNDCEVIHRRLRRLCFTLGEGDARSGVFVLDSGSTCHELFGKYGRLMRS